MIQAGADVNKQSHGHCRENSDETPLHMASFSGHVGCATELIASGADVNKKDEHGNTALMRTCQGGLNGFVKCVRALILAGADGESVGNQTDLHQGRGI